MIHITTRDVSMVFLMWCAFVTLVVLACSAVIYVSNRGGIRYLLRRDEVEEEEPKKEEKLPPIKYYDKLPKP